MISLRRSIDAKCRQCIYDPQSGLGAWREQVTACTVVRCPLYSVRPQTRTQPLVRRDVPTALANYRRQKTVGGVP